MHDAADLLCVFARLADATMSPVLDSRRQLEEWQNGPQPEKVLNLNIPLLMQNKVPEGFEDGDHIKVDLRPESVSTQTAEFRSFVKASFDGSNLISGSLYLRAIDALKQGDVNTHHTVSFFV